MAADAEREAAERATRRQFFRLFGRQTVASAGNLWAGVEALRQTSQEALDELLTGELPAPTRHTDPRLRVDPSPPAQPAADALRSPYRLDTDALLILDQRKLPERVVNIRCTDASEVASAIRAGILGAGPVLGQVAACTLVLALSAAADRPSYARHAALRAAADTLRAARPINRPLLGAIERVLTAAEGSDDDLTAVRAAVDLLVMEAAIDHARLGEAAARVLAELVPGDGESAGRPLQLLLLGDLGPLAGGMVGPGFAIVQALLAVRRPAHAWLPDGAPLMEGRRAAWQLAQLDVPHTAVPDASVGWLLANRPLDAVLLRTELVCANGDAIGPLGAATVARLATDAGVPVYAVAPAAVHDAQALDGSDVATDLLLPSADSATERLDPSAELVPATLLSGTFGGPT
jgi:methylthioribose-1-phosphate isomerase